ncbi:hypothetical protein INS49_015025 [Diaporthe citri]|uniref:uncharacterized protein n=1 Tax=Diaporthe citri TaxID=83186 RepID=UPI001C7F5FCC|nr:uncharacterized protein INS49_015025 [Diaporthe citri]KAG6357148.1 hypothetical protein INS49_015025 [Diaporthe citri]
MSPVSLQTRNRIVSIRVNLSSRTTEAPLLPPTHPLRSALTRYGRYAARHVLATLLISVAVAGILIYPCPFLYTTDYTVAAPNLPLHVWTDAQPVDDRPAVEPDVIMRTIWVHGSYMQALDREVLLGALELQDAILGPTTDFNPRQPTTDLNEKERDAFHVVNGLTNQSWFFHSPLQYWACDAGNIARDVDFINTVNEKKTQPTSVNVTLRHSIVFSGKKFEDRRLIAADALVITLLHLQDSPVGRLWGRKTKESAARMADKWDVFPRSGVSAGSQLFEFQFRPISIQDAILLSLAYLLTTTYFLLSLSKIRAVKSKLGLIVTVVAQIIMSIISSLTVCALFRIDLSRIPRAAYPLVLMAMSLENVFRLINAVILTPSDHNTSSRIGYAFGETGHVALASVAQNLLILWGLARVVSSGVSAFCTFAAIAILFDFFYLSTFFLSVLSVDVRRTELGDALEKASIRNNRMTLDGPPRQSIVDAILQGRIALSTRIAGTVVMLGFVLAAQWHFLQSGNARSPAGLWRHLWRTNSAEVSPHYAQIHQARSPKSWLRLQDHETAKEVINVIKPWAHSYVARVHDPVVFVLKGANRIPPKGVRWFPDAVYDFTHHQLTPFIVTVLVLVAMVRLLMNYLLWDEMVDARGEDDVDEEPLISVKSLANGHQLDIARLLVAPDSHVVSAGLDRKIRVWDLQYDFASHDLDKPGSPMDSPFPIQAMAVDSASNWLAILSTYRVLLWSITKQEWGPSAPIDLYGQKPEAFFFGPTRNNSRLSIVIVRRNGTMTEMFPDGLEHSDHMICKSPLSCAVTIAERPTSVQPDPRLSIVTLSRRSCIHRVDYIDGLWISSEAKIVGGTLEEPQALLPVQGFASYMVVRTHGVDLVDLYSRGHADPSPRRTKLEETWEIWVISRVEKEGNIETTPLVAPDDPAGLIISALGPMIKVGYSSAAVGFGNVVKIITVGHERFENADDEGAEDINLTNRRRRAPHSRPRVSSLSYKQYQR